MWNDDAVFVLCAALIRVRFFGLCKGGFGLGKVFFLKYSINVHIYT
jgi:hypothetical protein